jgi:hypothetical protein
MCKVIVKHKSTRGTNMKSPIKTIVFLLLLIPLSFAMAQDARAEGFFERLYRFIAQKPAIQKKVVIKSSAQIDYVKVEKAVADLKKPGVALSVDPLKKNIIRTRVGPYKVVSVIPKSLTRSDDVNIYVSKEGRTGVGGHGKYALGGKIVWGSGGLILSGDNVVGWYGNTTGDGMLPFIPSPNVSRLRGYRESGRKEFGERGEGDVGRDEPWYGLPGIEGCSDCVPVLLPIGVGGSGIRPPDRWAPPSAGGGGSYPVNPGDFMVVECGEEGGGGDAEGEGEGEAQTTEPTEEEEEEEAPADQPADSSGDQSAASASDTSADSSSDTSADSSSDTSADSSSDTSADSSSDTSADSSSDTSADSTDDQSADSSGDQPTEDDIDTTTEVDEEMEDAVDQAQRDLDGTGEKKPDPGAGKRDPAHDSATDQAKQAASDCTAAGCSKNKLSMELGEAAAKAKDSEYAWKAEGTAGPNGEWSYFVTNNAYGGGVYGYVCDTVPESGDSDSCANMEVD